MEFDVKRNEYTGGWYCKFEHNGEKLYADLSNVPFTGPECMIFGCDPSGNIVFEGDERYIARGGAISKEALIAHIEKFIEENAEEEEVSEDGEN